MPECGAAHAREINARHGPREEVVALRPSKQTALEEEAARVASHDAVLLALKVLKHIGTDTPVIDEHNTVRKFRLARVGDIALLEKSADDQSHNSMPRVFVDNDYYFSIFQVQPDNASRRCRRCGSIVSLAFLCFSTQGPRR
jgi:hypothetical protein